MQKTKLIRLRELLSQIQIPIKCGYLFVILILSAGHAPISAADVASIEQQQITINGTVTDDQGEPLPGVNVVIKGTTSGTVSDADGKFSISIPDRNAVLLFSYIGYASQEAAVKDQRSMNIIMREDIKEMNEVVVVGYGTQKKTTLTGSVVAINNEELVITKNNNVQNMMTGKLPGLRVIQKTSEPGQFDNQFDIRGLGTPLVIVDGVPRSDYQRMDPNDIESVSILKDASAAIYGMRAANGVVLITTRSGSKQRASIEYSGYYGIQTPAERLHPLDSYNRALLFNETTMRSLNNGTKVYDAQQLQDMLDGKLPNTDWYGEILRNTAPQQQHNVSIKGGADKIDYYVNLGYNNQGSFFKTNSSNYERYNLRSNLNATIVDNLKASVKLNLITDKTKRQNYDAWTIFKALWRSIPTDPVFANNTEPYYQHPNSGDIENVVPLIHPELSGEVNDKKTILQSNLSLNYQAPFLKGLSGNFMFSYDKTFNDDSNFKKAFDEYTYNQASGEYTVYTRNSQTQLTRTYSTNWSKLWNLSLNYDNTFIQAHHVGALLLYEESYNQSYDFHGMRYFSIPVPYLFAGDTQNQEGSGSGLSESANRALIGRLNYDFLGKYLFEFAFRYDGSSRFPKGKQWGFFPSIQLGYRISEESFIKNNVSFIDNLKLRGSWGKLGDDTSNDSNMDIAGFDYPATDNSLDLPNGYVFGNDFVNAIGFRNAPNTDVTWYSSTMKNIGIDIDLQHDLFGLSFDLFRRDRNGLLDTPEVIVPGTFGSGISKANLNADRVKGLELELRHRNRVTRDFSYNVTGFVSMTRSMLTKKVQSNYTNSYDYWRNNMVNRYGDIWFGRGSAGIFQNWDEIANSIYADAGTLPGDPIYEDWNGDGVIDDNDQHPIATTSVNTDDNANPNDFQNKRNYPLMNFGLTIGAQYKSLDITVHFQGSALSYVSYGEQLLNPLSWDGNALELLFDRWHPVNPDVNPYDPSLQWISGRYPYGRTRADVNSSFNIQNGSYLRLKNLELGFTVPQKVIPVQSKISRLRLFVNAYDLLTFTKVIGLDPEKPTEQYGYMYPLNRTFNFGGTITF